MRWVRQPTEPGERRSSPPAGIFLHIFIALYHGYLDASFERQTRPEQVRGIVHCYRLHLDNLLFRQADLELARRSRFSLQIFPAFRAFPVA